MIDGSVGDGRRSDSINENEVGDNPNW